MKKKFLVFVCIAIISVSHVSSATASDINIEIWNTGSVWAGQGYIAYQFTLDSGFMPDEIADIIIKTNCGDLEVKNIGGSNANRYATTILESQEDIKSMQITGVTGKINGKRINLKKYFAVRKFVPVKITIK